MFNSPTRIPDSEIVQLAGLIRKRWHVAVQHVLPVKSGKFSDSSEVYDEAFWGKPSEWEELCSTSHCVADILTPVTPCLVYDSESIPEEHPVLLYADEVDGYLCIHRLLGDREAHWTAGYESWMPYDSKRFQRNLGRYQDNTTDCRWCLAGERCNDIAAIIRDCSQKSSVRCRVRFPDMEGVELHADLTIDALKVAYRLSSGIREVTLPAWGLKSWMQEIGENAIADSMHDALRLLVSNQGQMLIDSGGNQNHVLPQAMECARFVKLMLNMLPQEPAATIRVSGWFVTSAFSKSIHDVLGARYARVELGAAYQDFSCYE